MRLSPISREGCPEEQTILGKIRGRRTFSTMSELKSEEVTLGSVYARGGSGK